MTEAEEYLVKVYDTHTDIEIFDELRIKVWTVTNSVYNLPPTMFSIRNGHIRRWWFLYKHLGSLLNPGEYDFLSPQDYGWDVLDGDLLPEKCLNLVPDVN